MVRSGVVPRASAKPFMGDSNLSSFIWFVADLLRRTSQLGPMCLLAPIPSST
jgi:hypothetical protein